MLIGEVDLRFTTDTGRNNTNTHEVVNWDIVNSVAEVHVKIPTLVITQLLQYMYGRVMRVQWFLARNDTLW